MKGSEAFIETLLALNTEFLFSLPGTTILDIYDAIYAKGKPRLIVSRHEQVAAYMADGYARAAEKPGICLVSRGPGAANTAIGLHNAYQESSPVVAVVGDVSCAVSQRNCFEEMDLQRFFGPVTKGVFTIPASNRIPEILSRACWYCQTGRQRPVAVLLPQNIQKEDMDEPSLCPKLSNPPAFSVCSVEQARQAAERLFTARRPLLFLGGGSLRSHAEEPVTKLAERLGIPVVTTWLRTDAFPNRHELFLGSTGPGAVSATLEYFRNADLVMAVGCRFSEFSTHGFSLPTPDTALIHIDSDPEEIGRIFPPQLGIMSDAAQAVNKILQCLEDEPLSGSCRQIDRAAVEEALDRFKVETRLPSGTDGEGEIFSGNAVQAFQQGIPDNAWLVLDTATFGPWMTRYYGFQRPGTLIAPAGGCLGFGFGAALGAQLACPDRSVVCLVGDGGFAMVAQDIETAVRCNIPVTVVVCNNFAFGNIRSRQKTEYEGREIGGLYGKTDYAALARVYGAVGMTARTADELLASLQKALSGNRPTIIDMILGIESGMPPGAFPPRCRG